MAPLGFCQCENHEIKTRGKAPVAAISRKETDDKKLEAPAHNIPHHLGLKTKWRKATFVICAANQSALEAAGAGEGPLFEFQEKQEELIRA